VDFISDRQFGDKLMSYKLLVIPSLSILSADNIKLVTKFHANGGKIVAFGKSLEKDEWFEPIAAPAFLGLKSRGPSPWNRGQMRIVEVIPELFPAFHTEITVQSPEIVDALPMEQLIPGYIPKTRVETTALAANQDAYPSIIQSSDGQVVYCAFDSIYSEGLSNLLAGIVQKVLKIQREISVVSNQNEDPAVMTAINESGKVKVLLIANSSPNPGKWQCKLAVPFSGKLTDITGSKVITIKNGKFEIKLAGYGYGVYRF
jgi:beta-galactosidase